MSLEEFETRLNHWGQEKTPFFFLIDFEMQKPVAIPLASVDVRDVLYQIGGKTNARRDQEEATINLKLNRAPISFDDYQSKFDRVLNHLRKGDTYLANLAIKTPIELENDFSTIFRLAAARYKLLYHNEFLVFSPEIFVIIRDNKIYSYPMKGTIDAGVPDAEQVILADEKELAEHVTIVDLIRNDLSTVAEDVSVTRFRYIDRIHTLEKNLLQVSSEIVGTIRPELSFKFGSILRQLLPAGSVSGAPKKKTVEIIHEAEGETRGYYTGVFGIFDGKEFDSGVMIRFIEKVDGNLFYRSGGGITAKSSARQEYQEVLDKIYVPIN